MKTHRLIVLPLLCLLTVFGTVTQSQTFMVVPKVLSAKGDTSSYIDTFADVENLSQAQANLRIQLTNSTMPEGWSASFCMVNCYAPEANDVTDTFEPKQKVSFHITWSTSSVPATGSLTYKLTNVANTSETYTITFTASTITTSIMERPSLLRSPALAQNYPNPFSVSKQNNGVTIGYSTVKAGFVTMKVYDLIGHEIATIVNEVKPAGTHRAYWNGLDYQKNLIAPGIYIYKLISGGTSLSRRLLVTR
jgi:hypothetical protein